MAVAGNNGLKLELEADNWYNTLCLNVGVVVCFADRQLGYWDQKERWNHRAGRIR